MTHNAAVSGRAPGQPRSIAGVLLAFLGAVALTMGVTGSPAAASDDFTIDLYEVVRTEQGTETSLGSWSVPAELQGQSCVATSTPVNNSSIHPGNDLRIVSATTITLVDVEGTGNPVTSTDQITLGEQVEVILVMGPDGVYSAGIAVSFDCPPAPTTTTSTTTTTTTTTMAPTTTTTVAPTTTTTSPAVGNNPPTTSSTTTSTTQPCVYNPNLEPDDPDCVPTTVTTADVAAQTTVAPASTSPTTVAAQLPRTGPGTTDTMLVLGALMLLVGGVMVLSTRRKHELV